MPGNKQTGKSAFVARPDTPQRHLVAVVRGVHSRPPQRVKVSTGPHAAPTLATTTDTAFPPPAPLSASVSPGMKARLAPLRLTIAPVDLVSTGPHASTNSMDTDASAMKTTRSVSD